MGRYTALAALLGCLPLACSGSDPGVEGSQLEIPFEALGGGIIFATRAFRGSSGYDLYLIPTPDTKTTLAQPSLRLTTASGDERQPSVAANGNGLAFATDDGIFVLAQSGRFRRISNTSGTAFQDSIPAVSPNADRVAWIRADTSRPIAGTSLFESYVVMANFDGTEQTTLDAKPGIIQDAPAFDPTPMSTRIAWTEFNATTVVAGFGPRDYGVWIFNFSTNTGVYACKSGPDGATIGASMLPPRSNGRPYRCFGEHLSWPAPSTLMLSQDLLLIHLDTNGSLGTVWDTVMMSLSTQQSGIPEITPRNDGFFAPFPMSASWSQDRGSFVFDGLMASIDGNDTTLSFLISQADGGSVYRIQIDGYASDFDTLATSTFLYSVATPQMIPFLH